jgi:cell division protein FtsN
MNRLRDWLGSESGHFWLITASICIIFCLGGYFGGRLWVNRYLATQAATNPGLNGSGLTPQPGQPGQPNQTPNDERPRWSQSPSVVIRERQPSDLERQQLTAPSQEAPPGGATGTEGQPATDQGASPDTSTGAAPGSQPATPPPSDSTPAPPPSGGAGAETGSAAGQWTATAGSYRDRRNAQQVADSLSAQGLDATVERVTSGGKTSYRVSAGSFSSKAEADAAGEVIQAAGYPSKVKRAN